LDKAQQKIEALEGNITEVKNNLEHLIDFAIRYFNHLKKPMDQERNASLKSEYLMM
jgi:topoisomerase-4 subunit A